MSRLLGLFKKDIILGFKDMFIILELAFAVVVSAMLVFVVPEDTETEGMVYLWDRTGILENYIMEHAADELEQGGEFFVQSREEIIDGMRENRSALGLIISANGNGAYDVELLAPPYTKSGMVRYIEAEMEDIFAMLHPPHGLYPPDVYQAVRIDSLQWGARDDIPFNQRMLPPMILMMVGMIGLFAIVSLVGQERLELTVRALRVSPASLTHFIVSKHMIILLTGILSFSVLYLPMLGFQGFLESLLVIVLTIFLGSSIGVVLGAFFKNPIGSMLWVMLVMIVLALPAISLLAPAFSPGWIRIIPSYHTLFALDAAMFPDDNRQIIWQGVLVLACLDAVLLPLTTFIFNLKQRKEA